MTQQTNPILLYHPDAYQVSRKDLKGRHAAGEGFLTAYLEYTDGPEVYGLSFDQQAFEEFERSVKASGRPLTAHSVRRSDVEILRRQALLSLPHPGIGAEARIRTFLGDDAYAVCGVTHSISSRVVLDGFADMLVAPVNTWDALICTSHAVHSAVTQVLDLAEDHLRTRLGAKTFVRPQMPIIPLGVHAKRFSRNNAERARWRKSLGVADDVVVIMFFGRLSVHAKASPFQLAQATEQAARRTKSKLAILWCGWFNDDFQQQVFMKTAKSMAPSIPFYFVDGREEPARFSIWSAADIFCSLSDNIQESFGLTIVEAMAAGLPVVASNWNGYREAVVDGNNGLLADSYMPAGTQADIAYRYISGLDSYDRYIGALSQLCFVNLEQVTNALTLLADNETLRKTFAEKAQKTIAEQFDWATVLPRYLDLWNEQVDRLTQARAQQGRFSCVWKALAPGIIFDGFPSHRLRGDNLIACGEQFHAWADLIDQPGILINGHVLTGRRQLALLHKLFADKQPHTIDDARKSFDSEDADAVLRTLHWLIKIGLLRMLQ